MKTFISVLLLIIFSKFSFSQTMIVKVEGIREVKGELLAFLFNNEEDFPTKRDKAFRAEKIQIPATAFTFSFKDVPKGTYGVAVYHDENMNGKMDRHWYGTPMEGYGASRDAQGTLGPPKFDDAKFNFKNSQDTIKIFIHY